MQGQRRIGWNGTKPEPIVIQAANRGGIERTALTDRLPHGFPDPGIPDVSIDTEYVEANPIPHFGDGLKQLASDFLFDRGLVVREQSLASRQQQSAAPFQGVASRDPGDVRRRGNGSVSKVVMGKKTSSRRRLCEKPTRRQLQLPKSPPWSGGNGRICRAGLRVWGSRFMVKLQRNFGQLGHFARRESKIPPVMPARARWPLACLL